MTRKLKLVVALCCASAAGAIAVPVVQAVTSDTDDGIGVAVASSLKPNTVATLKATITGVGTTTTTCTGSATSTTLSTLGPKLGPFVITNPTFTGCTDSLGGADTVTTNSTNGHWTTTFVDAAGDEAKEVTGDKIVDGVPKAGETVTSTKLPGCTLVVAPTTPASLAGAYDDKGTLTFTNAAVPFTVTGTTCSLNGKSGTATLTTTLKSGSTGTPGYAVTPPIFDVS